MNNQITERQYIAVVLNSIIGIGALYVAADICKISENDGWISIALGGFFPLVLLLIIHYIDKKMNHQDFWSITNILYGKYLSYFIFSILMINAVVYEITVLVRYTDILKLSISEYTPAFASILILTAITIYTTKYGLTVIGRLCELSLYFLIPAVLLLLVFIPKGSITNIQPILATKEKILYAIPESIFAYSGAEIGFLVAPLVTNKKNIKKSCFTISFLVTSLYTFSIFMTIYYLGWELTSKLRTPTLFIYELIRIPLLSDFKSIFVIIWSNAILVTLNVYQFYICYCGSKIFNCSFKCCCNILFPFIVILSFIAITHKNILLMILLNIIPYLFLFIILLALISFVLTHFKTQGGM